MTTEEAVDILDQEKSRNALMQKMGGVWNQLFASALISRAQDMGLAALCAQAAIVHCRDCAHLYTKDFSAYCPHRVGPCSPDGFCDRGERRTKMERLTKKSGDTVRYKCGNLLLEPCEIISYGDTKIILDRLAAYEDTEMTPEEITDFVERWKDVAELAGLCKQHGEHLKELVQAESEGRLIVLPCRVTDTVYVVESVFENGRQKKRNKPSGERVVSAQIDHVTIGGTTGEPVFDLCTETGNWYTSMDPEDFYLTRKEAEKAMRRV